MKKIIHIIWIGDESKRPDSYIESWRRFNPTWEVKVWGNTEYHSYPWRLKNQMIHRWESMNELNGVADLMRWEILFNEGGFGVDADGPCIRTLDDWLFLDTEMAACFESEQALPGRIASGYLYSNPRNPIVGAILDRIEKNSRMKNIEAWRALATMQVTYEYHLRRPLDSEFRVWPSYYFIPEHRWALPYKGTGPIFSKQMFMTTHGTYKNSYEYNSDIDEYNNAKKA